VALPTDRLAALWTTPPTGDDRDDQAFLAVYTDPVSLNGTAVRVADLVARYRALHAAFADLAIDQVARLDAPGGLAVALRQRGRHAGPLATPAGELSATGRPFDVLGIDILGLADDGRIATIWVVADELGRLVQLGALPTP
jgi:hypothetical protein